MIGYKKLKAGVVRTIGDEQRRVSPHEPPHYGERYMQKHSHEFRFRPVDLLGHPIIKPDLMHLEFRRPVEVAVD